MLFTNGPDLIGPTYHRYLLNVFREQLPFHDVPIKLHVRHKRKNEQLPDVPTELEQEVEVEDEARDRAKTQGGPLETQLQDGDERGRSGAREVEVRVGVVERPLSVGESPMNPPSSSGHTDGGSVARPRAVRIGRAPGRIKRVTLTGKVRPLADLVDELGSKLDADAVPYHVALVAEDGKVYPLIKDAGGRLFFLDKKLLDRPMRLSGKLLPGSQLLQVLEVHSLIKDVPHNIYYWCDICSIKRHTRR